MKNKIKTISANVRFLRNKIKELLQLITHVWHWDECSKDRNKKFGPYVGISILFTENYHIKYEDKINTYNYLNKRKKKSTFFIRM